jgi:ribA/ribD-fused uncharacterized protein
MNVKALIAQRDEGILHQFLFFWGHHGKKDGAVGKECLSQWYPAPFQFAGETYPTAEHFMMVWKARTFGDEATAKRVFADPSPETAKFCGRAVQGFNDEKWNQCKFQIVVTGSFAKFSKNPALREFLLSTGDKVLVEGSPHDRIWGIGMRGDLNPDSFDPRKWRGENLLGFALMEARRMIRAQ